MLLRGSTEQGS